MRKARQIFPISNIQWNFDLVKKYLKELNKKINEVLKKYYLKICEFVMEQHCSHFPE